VRITGLREAGAEETAALLTVERPAGGSKTASPHGPLDVSFTDILSDLVEQANAADRSAATKVDALARGASDDLHGTMIATKEADISIKLVGTIRNKLLDAFQEIWKTSV